MMTNEKRKSRGTAFEHQQAVMALESMTEVVEVRRAPAEGRHAPRAVQPLAKKRDNLSTFEVELLEAWSQP